MQLNDTKKSPVLEGYLKAERLTESGSWELFDEQNLVLDQATETLRNLMFGDAAQAITRIKFGDMNLDPAVDNVSTVAAPSVTDTTLVNEVFEKVATSTKVVYSGSPAIQYEVILDANEFNGTGSQLITEYALANASNVIFTRKTRAAIFKDAESTLRFTWTLVFN